MSGGWPQRHRAGRAAALLALTLAEPAHGHAAQVTGVSSGGREVHVKLADHESVQPGASVQAGPRTPPLRVVEVVGQRARLWSDQPVQLAVHQQLSMPHAVRATAPLPPRQAWRLTSKPDAAAGEKLAAQQTRWQILQEAWQPWIAAPLRRGGAPARQIKGQVNLAAVGVAGDSPWAALRMGHDVQWLGVMGTPLAWRHDVAVWVEPWQASAGPSANRALQVRQAQLSLDPQFSRPWGAALGRVWVPEGGASATLDGAAVRVRPLPQLEITSYAGSVPSLRTTAVQPSAWRAGAAAVWRGRWRGWQSELGADGSLGRVAGGWDRGQVALRARGEHQRLGRAEAELQLGLGQASLADTAWASEAAPPGGVRPLRATLDYAPTQLGRWRPRLRYQYTASELTRELAWTLPNQGWGTAQSHALSGWLELPNWWGLRTAASGWASLTSSEDPWEDWRFGGTVQLSKPGWPAGNCDSQLVAVAQTGPYLSGGSLAAGLVWSPGLQWSWHGRLRWNHDRVETSGSTAQGLDARIGLDWGRHPWSVGLSFGGRRTLWTDVEVTRDWLDATVNATYRL